MHASHHAAACAKLMGGGRKPGWPERLRTEDVGVVGDHGELSLPAGGCADACSAILNVPFMVASPSVLVTSKKLHGTGLNE